MLEDINWSEVEDTDSIPNGDHNAVVTGVEFKDTSSGGKMVKVEFTLEGNMAHNGRKVWNNFNIVNDSAEAQRIGRGQFKTFMKKAGYVNLNSPQLEELNGLKVMIKVGSREYEGETFNEVKGYKLFSVADESQVNIDF